MSKNNIAASIVAYKNEPAELLRAIKCVLSSSIPIKLTVVDNSPSRELQNAVEAIGACYIHVGKNIGFGAAHNIAMRASLAESIKYHLALNPDIYFDGPVLEKLQEFMDANEDVGLAMPRILNENGSDQRLCKLLPTPFDLFRRRFGRKSARNHQKNASFELHFSGYDLQMDVPYLSGCFMFLRTESLRRQGLFDERFFMYCEDIDLCRRIGRSYRTVYYPAVSVYHGYAKMSYKNPLLLKSHIVSALKYFWKWGFLMDPNRSSINRLALEKIRQEKKGNFDKCQN